MGEGENTKERNEGVEVYSLPKCTYCGPVKDFLHENGVTYLDYNVANDGDARKRLLEVYGVKSVPLTVFPDGTTVSGFDKDALLKGIRKLK